MSLWQNIDLLQFEGVGQFDIPQIEPIYELPNVEKWTRYNYSKSMTRNNRDKLGIHFFVDDYQFERLWNRADRETEYLRQFGCILSPDFSMFTDFPLALQIWNKYRNHWLARYWQENNLTVIPTISWGDEKSFEWCFEGFPKDSIVAVSSVGNMKRQEDREAFILGYNEMLNRINPTEILVFTRKFDIELEGNVRYIRYDRWSN